MKQHSTPLPKPSKRPSYQPKAFYSATRQPGILVCWRCKAAVKEEEVAQHTAVCWPEVGRVD